MALPTKTLLSMCKVWKDYILWVQHFTYLNNIFVVLIRVESEFSKVLRVNHDIFNESIYIEIMTSQHRIEY